MIRITQIAVTLLMSATASTALACKLPPLVAIPEKDDVGDQGPRIRVETAAYFDAMKVFTACVQAELTAAGGDSAPTLSKAVLVQRNNTAVAEVEAVLKAFNASLGAAEGAAGATPAPQGGNDGGRRRDR
jgi:hypothetical protein